MTDFCHTIILCLEAMIFQSTGLQFTVRHRQVSKTQSYIKKKTMFPHRVFFLLLQAVGVWLIVVLYDVSRKEIRNLTFSKLAKDCRLSCRWFMSFNISSLVKIHKIFCKRLTNMIKEKQRQVLNLSISKKKCFLLKGRIKIYPSAKVDHQHN